MSARDHKHLVRDKSLTAEAKGIGLRIKEWMIWAEKRNATTHNLNRVLSPTEVARHDSKNDLWIAIDGVVYDVTLFSMYHPGGKEYLLRTAGRDATDEFNRAHSWVDHETIMRGYIVGVLPTMEGATTQEPSTAYPPSRPLSMPSSSIMPNERQVMKAALGAGLFQSTTELQREAMLMRNTNDSPGSEEEALGALFDELDTQRTGYVLRSSVEQVIVALNEGSPTDGITLQRLQSIRSELMNRRQFILLFL